MLHYSSYILGDFTPEFQTGMREIFDNYWEKMRNSEINALESIYILFEFVHINYVSEFITKEFRAQFQRLVASNIEKLQASAVVRLIL